MSIWKIVAIGCIAILLLGIFLKALSLLIIGAAAGVAVALFVKSKTT